MNLSAVTSQAHTNPCNSGTTAFSSLGSARAVFFAAAHNRQPTVAVSKRLYLSPVLRLPDGDSAPPHLPWRDGNCGLSGATPDLMSRLSFEKLAENLLADVSDADEARGLTRGLSTDAGKRLLPAAASRPFPLTESNHFAHFGFSGSLACTCELTRRTFAKWQNLVAGS
jgi:hypothetical protein